MRNILRATWLIPAVMLTLTACNANNQATDDRNRVKNFQEEIQREGQVNNYNQQRPLQRDVNNNEHGLGDRAPETNNRNNVTAQEVADRLVKLATRIDHVNDATAVVIGRWAVVGIDVDAKLDRSRVGSIKYSVAEALKADPKGAYAIVTADVDTNQRLREMNREIRQGQPVEGFMDELAAIVGRIMPQAPRNVQDPDEPIDRGDVQDTNRTRMMERQR